jgi:NAD(P)-dependent dehydrogenase (short-subunit alcohol dehydrogenase family)
MSERERPGDVPDYLQRARLDGRVFVVLGAGAGMGRQAVHALAQAGAQVACADQDAALAQDVADEVGGLPLTADVTNRAGVADIFAAAEREHGAVHGVVDVVGAADIGPLADLDDERWQHQLQIVVGHAFLVLQEGTAAVRRAGGGTITFVGSISGVRAVPQQSAYGAAKAALHHLVSCMGPELAADGVRVNAIAPGWVRTPRLEARLGAEAWATVDATIPRGSAAVPAEIAAPILFLAGDLSSYVTGQVLVADGGLTTAAPHPDVFGGSR